MNICNLPTWVTESYRHLAKQNWGRYLILVIFPDQRIYLLKDSVIITSSLSFKKITFSRIIFFCLWRSLIWFKCPLPDIDNFCTSKGGIILVDFSITNYFWKLLIALKIFKGILWHCQLHSWSRTINEIVR